MKNQQDVNNMILFLRGLVKKHNLEIDFELSDLDNNYLIFKGGDDKDIANFNLALTEYCLNKLN